MEFSSKVAVITGGSEGIGKATAINLAKRGANLAIIARNKTRLSKAQKDFSQYGTNIKIYSCDVSKPKEIKKTFAQIKKDFGKINFLINNAGFSSSLPIDQLAEKTFDSEFATSAKSTYFCTKEAYPLMIDGGAIVNVSSVRGRKGSSRTSAGYAAAKAAVINLTKSLALQLAKYHIRVNAVAPGAIYPTNMSQNWNKQKRTEIIEKNVLHRLGTPEDVANTIYFLISDLSSYINGHTIDINGGDWMN